MQWDQSTLNEIAYAPHSVTAAQNGTYTAIGPELDAT
jgi:hypothetical protein